MKIIVSGGWSYGNIGDEVIALCTLENIKKYFPESEVTITSYEPSDFSYHFGIETQLSIHRIFVDNHISDISLLDDIICSPENYGLAEYCTLFTSDSVFIMSGGGYFISDWHSNYLARLCEILLAKKYGAKVIVLGQSIGPIGEEFVPSARKAFLQCDYICVRDRSSQKLVNTILEKDTADLSCDIAVTVSDFLQKNKYNDGKSHVGLTIQTFAYHVSNGTKSNTNNSTWCKIKKRITFVKYIYDRKIQKLITGLLKDPNVVLDFVQSVHTTSSINNDHFLQYVNKQTRNLDSSRYKIHSNLSCREFCDTLSACDTVISVKMHPLVVSSSFGVPTIALSQNFKINDYMASIGRDGYCQNNNDFKVNHVIDSVNKGLSSKDFAMKNEIDAKKKAIDSMFNKVVEICK